MQAKTVAHPLSLAACLLAMVLVAAGAQPSPDKEKILNELELVDDDGSIDAAVMNYLFAKQIVNRLRQQADVSDLQRKRSYWKQCAFNAVSCFGK